MAIETGHDRSDWVRPTILIWIAICIGLVYWRWSGITWFALGDTDDNMRLMQVRALLNGQDWYDLSQHRLAGSNIHWSRFVDLPIAGLILLFRPIFGGQSAEYIAISIAPMLPMLLVLLSLGLVARRMIGSTAWIFAIGMFASSQMLMPMYAPLRIDHHGWQLALVALLVAAIADPEKRRGGVLAGVATALSLVIGLEMIPYLALAGATFVARWIADCDEAPRLRAYGITLAVGTGLGYLVFASIANRAPRCDALTPVWLSAMVGAGLVCAILSIARVKDWRTRLVQASVLGGILAAGLAWSWPQCMGQLEQLSPDLKRYWYDHVREVKPMYEQSFELISVLSFAIVAGLVGYAHGLWQSFGTSRFAVWASLTLLFIAASGLVFWQTRAGPTVQLLSIPGLTFLAALYIPMVRNTTSVLRRVFGTVLVFALISGLAVQLGTVYWSKLTAKPVKGRTDKINASCSTIPSLAPIGRIPAARIFTFVDLSPRLITLTPHSAITGPYHRNGEAIVDVHRAFRASTDEAEKIIRKYRSDYLLVCPGSSETTIFKAEAAKGFYAQLAANKIPDWLKPVPLPKGSPYRMWKILPPKT